MSLLIIYKGVNMYTAIEEQFKNESNVMKNQAAYLLSILFLFMIECVVVHYLPKDFTTITIAVICGVCLFWLSCYVFIVISNAKHTPKFWKKMYNIFLNIKVFRMRSQQQDTAILKNIIEDNKINTRDEIKELIRHYQCYLPRQGKKSSNIISLFALVVSIWALLYQDRLENLSLHLGLIVLAFLAILLIYFIILVSYNSLFKVLGKTALYTRIEAALAEIYVNYPVAKRKTKSVK